MYVDGSIAKNTTLNREYDAPGWVNINNSLGYVMLTRSDVNIKRSINEVNTYLTISIDHGTKPVSKSYAYVVLPNATTEETEDFAHSDRIEIIAMNEDLHAIRDLESGIIAANAFSPNQKILDFTFSDSCSIIISENNGTYSLSVADPTLTSPGLSILAPSYSLAEETDSAVMQDGIINVTFKERGGTVTFNLVK